MTPAQLKEWGIVALVVAVIGGGIGFTLHERSVGALEERLKGVTARTDTLSKKADTLAVVAAGAAQEAERQKARAMAQLAAEKAAQAKLDSTVRASANERARAEQLLRDTAATTAELRAELGRSLAQSRADSANAQSRVDALVRTQVLLLATISADSAALSAEQSHARSLEAVNQSLRKEVDLMKQSAPSKFGGIVKIVAWSAGTFVLGRVTK